MNLDGCPIRNFCLHLAQLRDVCNRQNEQLAQQNAAARSAPPPVDPERKLVCSFCGKVYHGDLNQMTQEQVERAERQHMSECERHPYRACAQRNVDLYVELTQLRMDKHELQQKYDKLAGSCRCAHCGADIGIERGTDPFGPENRERMLKHSQECPGLTDEQKERCRGRTEPGRQIPAPESDGAGAETGAGQAKRNKPRRSARATKKKPRRRA